MPGVVGWRGAGSGRVTGAGGVSACGVPGVVGWRGAGSGRVTGAGGVGGMGGGGGGGGVAATGWFCRGGMPAR